MSLPEPRGLLDLVARMTLARRVARSVCNLPAKDLLLLMVNEPTRLRDLVSDGHFTKSQATNIVKRLATDLLVEVSQDAADGRGLVVSLTDAGRKYLFDIRKKFYELGTVDATQVAELCAATERSASLLARLKSEQENAS